MLCSIKQLDGMALAARDGEIGHAREVYFDDAQWVVRHLVADSGGWLSGRRVLISPHAIAGIDVARRRIEVALTKQQVRDAPGIDTDRPVSRQHEIHYYDHYGYPYYWQGGGLWGALALPLGGDAVLPAPPVSASADTAREAAEAERERADPHLRSSKDVIGYHLEASDGGIGHIDDFLFDDRSWQLRQAVVDTRNWLPGRLVLIAPPAIARIDWNDRKAHVAATREAIRTSPPYDRGAPFSAEDEQRVQRHYEGWQ